MQPSRRQQCHRGVHVPRTPNAFSPTPAERTAICKPTLEAAAMTKPGVQKLRDAAHFLTITRNLLSVSICKPCRRCMPSKSTCTDGICEPRQHAGASFKGANVNVSVHAPGKTLGADKGQVPTNCAGTPLRSSTVQICLLSEFYTFLIFGNRVISVQP